MAMEEELLNGGFGGPVWDSAASATVSAVPQNIREAAASPATGSAPQSVMIAWVAVLIVVVLAHVLTFEQQEEGHRHAHFNVFTALWTYVVLFYVVKPVLSYLLVDRFHVPGLSDLQKQA